MAKPFLKWAGGKNWFVNRESDRFPLTYNRYIEPFLGGGSVFFFLKPCDAILSDINQELIQTYISFKEEFPDVFKYLKIHYRNDSPNYYYKLRKTQTRKTYTAAARMIYLNKACFNGIYRVNQKGAFNVPYGKHKSFNLMENELMESSCCLKNAKILCQDFETTINMSINGDFIFCDPPYAVLNEENRFVAYNADSFSWDDQIRLAKSLERAAKRGVKIIMTNVNHPKVRELYENNPEFELDSVSRYCFISGTNAGRSVYSELIASANL